MATVNALSVALFNAAAGGYASELTANPAAFANAVGPVLQKDVSTDALFVDHLLANLGVTSTSSVYAQAKTAVAALVTTKGRAGAATDAIDFLKAQEGSTSAYATIAASFAAKVNAAAAFTTANATERDITKLISGVTGVDTDVVAINTAVAAQKAADDAAAAKAVADAAAAAKAAADAAAATALKAAQDKAAADLAALKAADDTAAATAATKAAADLKAANDQITALKNPVGGSFALTENSDVLIGVGKADQFSGTYANLDSTDILIDATTGDSDVLALSLTGSIGSTSSPTGGDNRAIVKNIENVNITQASTGAQTVDALNFSGVENLTVTRANVVVGGSNIAGDKTVTVSNVNSSNIAKVTVGAGSTGALSVVQATKAGITLDANVTTGTIATTGALTLNADNAASTVQLTSLSDTTQDAKPVTVNAAKATSVTTQDANFTGVIAINAAKATTVTVSNGSGGVTVNASTANTAAATIAVEKIDNSGATINVGTGTTAAGITVQLGGTTATTDTASVSGAGKIALDVGHTTGAVDTVNLSGTAAVTYTLTSTNGTLTTLNATGGNVSVKANDAMINAKTVTGVSTLSLTAHTAGDVTLSKVDAATNVSVEADLGGTDKLIVRDGQQITLASDQTTALVISSATTSAKTVTIATGDDNGTNTSTPDLTTGTLTVSGMAGGSNAPATVTIDATVGKFTLSTAATGGTATDFVVKGVQDVTLGTVTGQSLNATASTGAISLTSTTGLKTISTGSGDDSVTLNGSIAHVVSTGDGADTITITSTAATASIDGGAGNDTISIQDADAIVVVAGDGDDTITVGAAGLTVLTDAIIVGGNGTDTLVVDSNSDAVDLSSNANFAITGIEVIDLTNLDALMTLSAAQFANNNVVSLKGGSNDSFAVTAASTGSTINASKLTLTSGSAVAITYNSGAGNDVITGGVKNETFATSKGSDSYDGGLGTDTITLSGMVGVTETGSTASAAAVINLGSTPVTGASVVGKTGNYLAGGVTTVDSGTAAYSFGTDSTLNSSKIKTITSIENIVGSSGKDYIVGSSSNNRIDSGANNDYVLGGDGADTFVFSAVAANADTIGDFTTAQDRIELSKTAFSALAGSAGAHTLSTDFYSSTTAVTASTSTRAEAIIYDQTTGNIYYNTDGNTAGGLLLVGTVTAGASTIATTDFDIVA